MGRKRKPNLIVRTCRVDGIQWMVPAHLQRPPSRFELYCAKQQASGEHLRGGGRSWGPAGRGYNVKLARMESNVEQATRLLYCPLCGQQNWSQALSDVMPQAVELQVAAHQEAQRQAQWQEYYRQQAAQAHQPPPPDPRLQHLRWAAGAPR